MMSRLNSATGMVPRSEVVRSKSKEGGETVACAHVAIDHIS